MPKVDVEVIHSMPNAQNLTVVGRRFLLSPRKPFAVIAHSAVALTPIHLLGENRPGCHSARTRVHGKRLGPVR